MTSVLTKDIGDIGIDDVRALIDSQVREGQEIEFKEDLSTKKRSSDAWREGRLGDAAKQTILKQVTAFANAYGGALLLGIGESQTKPRVAERVSPIPRCADLAERLKLVVRDGVEPQVPNVEIAAIPMEDDDGVVVVRVGASRMAPHRVKSTRVCAVRRDDRTEEMTMREIQDMTLNVARGMERVERRFGERAERFVHEFARLQVPEQAWGIRVTALPVRDDLRIERVYSRFHVDARFVEPWRRVLCGGGAAHRWMDNAPKPDSWRPILRGARATYYSDQPANSPFDCYREIRCDGLAEAGCVSCRTGPNEETLYLPEGLPVVLLANTLTQAHCLRTEAGAPTAEYGVEVQFRVAGALPVRLVTDELPPREWVLRRDLGPLPRYSLVSAGEVPAILTTFYQDLWDNLGIAMNAEQFSMPDWPSGTDGP